MTTAKPPTYLRRYTDLPALLHMLASSQITLLDPKSWDDLNDAYYLSHYKERKQLKSVLALCFSQVPETYHHWHVFSKGPAGVCIVFDGAALLDALKEQPGVSTRTVEYLTLNEAKKHQLILQKLPFLKRTGFKPEGEFRIVFESKTEDRTDLNISIKLSCLRRVLLSPWLHENLSKSTIKSIRSIEGCKKLKVSRSTLISNEQWKSFARDTTNPRPSGTAQKSAAP